MQYVKGKADLVGEDGVLTVDAKTLGLTGPYDMKSRFDTMGYKSGSMFVLFSRDEGVPPAPPSLAISVVHPNTGTKELDSEERDDEFETAEDVAEAVRNLKGGKRRRRKTRKSKKSKRKGTTRRR